MIQNEAEFVAVLQIIKEDHQNNRSFFANHRSPEEMALDELALTTDERALFLTLSLVPYHVDSETGRPKPTFGRSGLWRVCANLWEQHPFVFSVEELIEKEKKPDIARLFGKLQIMDSYDADWWYQTTETLYEEFQGDPQGLLAEGNHQAPKIERLVKQYHFPGLADEVSTPLWLRLMHDHVTPLTAIEYIDLPVDHRIIEITNQLGGTEFDPEMGEDREALRNYWRVISNKHGITPIYLDKPLRLLRHHWKGEGSEYIADVLSSVRIK